MIGDHTFIHPDTVIDCDFEIGEYGYIGPGCEFKGNKITIGDHFYCSGGLKVGGGGHKGRRAKLTVGDRCTFHNNFINLCEEVRIGNDVGLSPEVSILTHGFWQSVLDGYPRNFDSVTIRDNTIIGYRSTILPGAIIQSGCVIGAGSVVPFGTYDKGIYAGNPARMIRQIKVPYIDDKLRIFVDMVLDLDFDLKYSYPFIYFKDCVIDVVKCTLTGEEDEDTDKLRDALRKYGIKIYTKRPF